MPRASYRSAIDWMARNGDTEWVEDGPPSVTASLVTDLFGKDDEQVRRHLRNALRRHARTRARPPPQGAADP